MRKLIFAIISLRWRGESDAFPENWRISRLFLLFSYRLTIVLVSRKTAIVAAAHRLRFPFLSLISFYSSLGHSRFPQGKRMENNAEQ